MSFLAIIPARMSSTRLPGKPLADIAGKPMVIRTAERAALSSASEVLIATDDQRIAAVAREHGVAVMLTRAEHASGTDRLAEVAARRQLPDDTIIVNVQGDEPLIDPALIDAVATLLASRTDAAIATCAAPITEAATLFDPNAVKVVCGTGDRALYFSRAPIPWARDALSTGAQVLADGLPALHHIGLYAYRAGFLRTFPTLPRGTLEHVEALEQLRALENGYGIVVYRAPHAPAAGVDTEQDLTRVRAHFANRL